MRSPVASAGTQEADHYPGPCYLIRTLVGNVAKYPKLPGPDRVPGASANVHRSCARHAGRDILTPLGGTHSGEWLRQQAGTVPFSNTATDDLTGFLLSRLAVRSALDVGAGAGKFGRLLRTHYPGALLEAIEIDRKHISEYGLESIYDSVRCVPAQSIIETDLDRIWDIVILGDVLEHLRKSDGIDLFHFLVYRSKYLLVIVPRALPQGAWEGHASEAHLSVWTEDDFAPFRHRRFERTAEGKEAEAQGCWTISFVAIDGYQLGEWELSVQAIFTTWDGVRESAASDQ